MAIMESPDSVGAASATTTTTTVVSRAEQESNELNYDRGGTLRRRGSAAAAKEVVKELESEPDSSFKGNSTDECENWSRSEIENGNSGGGGVELVRQLSRGKDEREKVGNSEGRGGGPESSIKFAYRPSAPAHRRIKESPLSSDAIFKQVQSCKVQSTKFLFSLGWVCSYTIFEYLKSLQGS